jgi:hypothetical protein
MPLQLIFFNVCFSSTGANRNSDPNQGAEMPMAADFRVINNLSHKLESEKPLTCDFVLPLNLSRGGDQPQSVLLVKYFLEGASALTWELCLNGSLVREQRFGKPSAVEHESV